MKSLVKAGNWAAGALLLSVAMASAQGPNTHKNMGMYDPATETTLKGTVEAVAQPTHGRMEGTHLTVKIGDQTREIMLGPTKFIASKGFSFAEGDSVEVTGSKVTMGGTAYIIAREVIKDGKTLTLRDKSGTPQWAGMMRHRAR
jgi:DNA/RNA endonuclease YhcR with UshA esterase domain